MRYPRGREGRRGFVMRRVTTTILLLGISASAQSQSIHKCFDGNGIPSFQNEPCQPVNTYNYNGYASRPVDQRRLDCEAAKDYRKNTLQTIGLKRDFDLLRSLDEKVANACSPR